MAKVYLSLGDKGGIGKSFIAALMTQYIMDDLPEARPVCLDLDMKNKTFSRYEGLSNDRFVLRSITDEVMYELMSL